MKLLEEQAVPGISASIDQVNGQLQDGGKQVFDSVKEGADQLKSSADQLLAGIQGTESMSQETGSGDQLGDTLERNAQEAGNQAAAAQAAAENLGGVESTDASYLSDSLQQAIDSGDIDAVVSVAWEAVAAAQQNGRWQPMRREAVSRKLLRLLGTAVPPCLRISRPWQRQPGRPGI